ARAPALHLAGLIAPGVAIVAHCVEHFAQHLHLDLQRIDAQGALGRASAVASGCIASCGARCMASGGKTRKSSTGSTSIAPASIRVALIRQADSTSATRPPPSSLDRASPPTAAPRPAADLFLSRRGAISRPRGAAGSERERSPPPTASSAVSAFTSHCSLASTSSSPDVLHDPGRYPFGRGVHHRLRGRLRSGRHPLVDVDVDVAARPAGQDLDGPLLALGVPHANPQQQAPMFELL